MKSQIYNQAKYYEIAFSFINQKKQADLFEKFIEKFSKIKVESVLDIACGTALQLEEMAKREYKSFGLDANAEMLNYLERKSLEKGLKIETIKADMNRFKLEKKVDFAYIMMGSIIYTKNNDLFLSHLDSVSESLNSGGLYLIENLAINWATCDFFKPQTWSIKEGGIKIKAFYKITLKNVLTQIVTQTLKLKVNDGGKKMEFTDEDDLKITFPEEFKLLVGKNNKFEFMGFFERETTKPLKKDFVDNIVILRKK